MQHLRLTHPELDFWIDVRLREFDGRWLAVADFADSPMSAPLKSRVRPSGMRWRRWANRTRATWRRALSSKGPSDERS